MSTAVAKVAFLQGQAWAKAPDGTLRALTVGSTLNDDDILVTAQGSRVELDVGNGEPLVVNGGQEVGMSRDFLADTATEADEALLSDASVQEALTVLNQGGDLLEELEETAAGDNTSSNSDGSSFVRLTRIVEGTGSQSFGYDAANTAGTGAPQNDADYINRAPLVTDQTLASNEDEVLTGQIIATDIEGDSITYALTSAPANGTLQLNPITGQFTFIPTANYFGPDSFVVTVTDSRGNASSTTITLNILSVNDAPTTNDINLTTDEDVPVNGQVVAEDIEGDTLTYTVSGQPAHGSVALNPATGAFVYTPSADYNGSDVFIVTVADGNGGTTTSTVRIGINPVNDAPVSNDQNLITDEDTPIDGQVVASDVDGDTLGYSVSAQPGNGVVVLNAATGGFTYTPNANYNGSDSFVVTISDGNGGTTTSRINIGINPVNDAPESADQNLTTPEDTPLNGQVVATDVENDTLAYVVSGQPTNGSVTLNPATGVFVYTPNANYNGSDSFVVTIDDGNGGTTTSRINIGVTPVNDAPVASNLNLTTPEDTPISNQISASDVDGDTLTFSLTGAPGNGSVSLNPATGNFTYTPNNNFNGSDSFVVTISDGNGGTTTSLVNIGVTPVNDAPSASNQNLTTPEDTPISGAISASDPDGDTLTYSVSGTPAHGNVVLNLATGGFTYTPNAAYNGSDSFVVTISDGQGGTTTSTVNIGVTPAAATTVSSVTSPSVTEGGDLVYDVTLSGPAASGTSLAYSLGGGTASAADYGSASFSNGVTLVGGNLIVPTGVSSFTVTIPTVDDAIAEVTETLPLSVGGVTGTGNIQDNDPAPKITSLGVTHATEGDNLVCTVTFDQVLGAPYTLSYSIGGGTASLADYGTPIFSNGVTVVGGNLLIPSGISSFNITLPTLDDSINEPTEIVPFTFGALTINGNIYDNDAAPSVSIDSVSVNEADGTATFTVTLSAASGRAINVDYTSSNGTATAGSDYTSVSGTLNFAAGETSKTITVNIADDSIFEGNENFFITLSNPTNATLGTAVGTGTIVDNDSATTVSSVSSPSVIEGGDLVYSIALSNPSASTTSLAYSLGGGSASATDYGTPTFNNGVTLVGGNLIIPAGVTSFTVTLPTVDDALNETAETVPLTIGGVTGTGTITDNDAVPSLSIDSVSVNENAGTATFTVTLSAASGQVVGVNYATSNGSATQPSDYTSTSGTLSFAAGETSKTITVPITDDNLFEGNETFNVVLSGATNATIATDTGVGTIVDNETAPTVTAISTPSTLEGADLVYSITLSNPSATPTSLAYSLGGGTAVAADIGTPTFN
ncbi:retention module-containing protein, partial [Cellvibrio sp. OA-2007]|uniref:retention module-containing protein n=1 Tax=Cellvibrio sp. OA-2007 TaxID=529823 RepID=UPI000A3E0E62